MLLDEGSRMWSGPSMQKQLEESLNTPYSDGIREALDQFNYNFVITDPFLMDHPIVYASEGFLKMTGYSRGEVIGRNGRFLQGPDTDRSSVIEIREAIRQEKSCQVRILNYKKDGTSFWNFFHLAPVFSKDEGRVIHFIGVQTPIRKCSRLCTSKDVENDIMKQDQSSANSNANASNNLIYFGSCRRELCREFSVDLGHSRLQNSCTQDDHKGRVVKHACEAKESDKQKAGAAIRCVMSELALFSKYTGKTVSDTKCDSADLVRVAPSINSSLTIALSRIQQSFVLVDPHLPEMPIVHASNSFLQLTGYSRDEVLGKNCKILQGPATDQEDISKIRQSIEAEQPCTVRILNYRKDGNPFWNLLHTAPVRNASGKVAFYVGVQLDVTGMEDNNHSDKGMTSQMKQLGVVGAVRVAVRSLLGAGPSK
uniref:Putative LOV domain-containing protein n=1 Tax=Phyllocladus hypophyllus TaxID=56900 RepID=A0A126WYI0_9CONI|nr:putative LOV domain-containing protein [Phyllocladus hypophyllus]